MTRRILLAAALLLLPLPMRAQRDVSGLDAIFARVTADAPGCVVAVSLHGELVFERAYGAADLERDVPLSTHSVFDVGSLRKQFLAAAILLLVEDERLALDDDVRRHVPELPDYGHTITIDHLLTHTSGIRDWTGMLGLTGGRVDVLDLILRQRRLNFAPGDEWSYSNSGYVLVKEIVERASGMPFAEFARRRLFEPLGMATTAYHEDLERVIEDRALPYAQDGAGWRLDLLAGEERGGGGALLSTAADLVRWNDALAGGRLGAFVTAKLHERTKLNNGRMLQYARGLVVDSEDGLDAVVHTGGAGGYSSWLGRFPQHGLSVALLCNTDALGTSRLANAVVDLLLPPDAVAAATADAPGPAAAADGVDLAGKAGLFFAEGTNRELRLASDGTTLRIVGGGPLVAVAADRFRIARPSLFVFSQDAFELRFVTADRLERIAMEGDVTRYRRAEPWSPDAAELQTFAGRYESEEIPSVLEIAPGPDGLVLRLRLQPRNALPLRPAAPDVLEAGRMLLRFRRDATRKVVAFDYGNPLLRDVAFVRTGDAAPARTAPPAPLRADADAAPAVPADLASLAGDYETRGGRRITVTVEAGRLYGEPTGSPKRELVHESGTTFTVAGAPTPAAVTFVLGADGRPTALVLRQDGAERRLSRVR